MVGLEVPRDLSNDQRKLLEALARSMEPNASSNNAAEVDPDHDLDEDKGLFDRIKERLG
jgi:DnaJ-class molecular chaperone